MRSGSKSTEVHGRGVMLRRGFPKFFLGEPFDEPLSCPGRVCGSEVKKKLKPLIGEAWKVIF